MQMIEPFHVIIPARYSSTRLKAKMLLPLAGKPMLQHVYELALKSKAQSVTIATDDAKIMMVANSFGAKVIMTRKEHSSGTSRISEAVKVLGLKDSDIVIGLQGDEPLLPYVIIDQVACNIAENPQAQMATLCEKMQSPEEVFNPSVVKVVLDKNNYALYFSRAPIPWERDNFMHEKITTLQSDHYRHIGLYAYRAKFLEEYMVSSPSQIESCEMLEQLRILWHGYKIHVALTKATVPPSVDTAEDLAKITAMMEKLK